MTSSLVGSEMCIRDRQLLVGVMPSLPVLPMKRSHDMQVALICEMMSWTVSYTHLTLPTICSV
eukprot:7368443-Prorocentrum_lima.AAC.1